MFSGKFYAFHRAEAAYKAATCVMLPRRSREQRLAFTVSCCTKINGTPMLAQDCRSISVISVHIQFLSTIDVPHPHGMRFCPPSSSVNVGLRRGRVFRRLRARLE